jgi:hypothetical protein
MQVPPVSFDEISLIIAVCAFTLLVSIELTSAQFNQGNLLVNKRNLKNAAYFMSALFLVTLIIRVFTL